jgi:hypothetical protein
MQPDFAARLLYQLINVEKIDTPEGMSGNNWHRYVIGRKGSTIEGMRPGSIKAVTRHAQSVVEDLNERLSGRAITAYAARRNSTSS